MKDYKWYRKWKGGTWHHMKVNSINIVTFWTRQPDLYFDCSTVNTESYSHKRAIRSELYE